MKHGIDEASLRAKHSEEAEELRRQLKEKDQKIKEYRSSHGKLEVFFHDVIKNISPVVSLPQMYKPKISKGSPIVATIQISDSHMGAVQSPNEIEGFNAFNPSITDRRNRDFAERVIDWVNVQRMGYTINELAILMTGDLISGDIHDELRITNAFPSPEQVVRAAKSHTEQIALLAPHFDKVTVEFISADNHARLTKKPQSKEEGKNSLNYLVGVLLESYIRNIPNLEFNLYEMLEKVVHVNTRQYLLSHGHGVRGWMGIPWYGIERKVGKEAQARLHIIMEALDQEMRRAKEIGFHTYIFGHFHTPFDSPMYSCSGSVQGTDAYDHKNGRHANPSQPAWLVHPTHGNFNRVNFDLSHIK